MKRSPALRQGKCWKSLLFLLAESDRKPTRYVESMMRHYPRALVRVCEKCGKLIQRYKMATELAIVCHGWRWVSMNGSGTENGVEMGLPRASSYRHAGEVCGRNSSPPLRKSDPVAWCIWSRMIGYVVVEKERFLHPQSTVEIELRTLRYRASRDFPCCPMRFSPPV